MAIIAILMDTRTEDRATQGCDLSAAASADWPGRLLPLRSRSSLPESDKSQGVWGKIPPFEKVYSSWKNRRETPLTNGRESEVHADVAGVAKGKGFGSLQTFLEGALQGGTKTRMAGPLPARGAEPLSPHIS
jgi:hypothetical protein